MTAKNKPKVTSLHYIDLSDAIGSQASITLYGKIVKDVTLDPSASGILHPRATSGTLILAQITGYLDQGKCQTLDNPVMVTLPEADGPADGCDWDPKEYAVWKGVPRNWITLHVDAKPRSLVEALNAGSNVASGAVPLASSLGVRDRVVKIVKDWVGMLTNPRGLDVLQVIWAANNPSGPFPDAAQDLVNKINAAFGTHLQGSDINPPGSIKTVDDLVSAVT